MRRELKLFLVVALWWIAALLVLVVIKDVKAKAMLSVAGNIAVAFPLTLIYALARGEGLAPLKDHWKPVVLISALAGLERNLTSLSLYFISASLKTAMHAFNPIFTFVIAAMLGADPSSREIIMKCKVQGSGMLLSALSFLAVGGVIAAIWGKAGGESHMQGILMNLGSGVAFAVKFSLAKMLLRKPTAEQDGYVLMQQKPTPSKVQLSIAMNLITGLAALPFVPLLDHGDMTLPPMMDTLIMGGCILVILLCQLQLTELTSPLTVAVLQALHNVVIVLYFSVLGGELLPAPVYYGFALSSIGAVFYSMAGSSKPKVAAESLKAPLATTAPIGVWTAVHR